jgi:threonyl-tRNA synthetase
LIEHYAGAFPLWLAPVQARVIPISVGQAAYAQEVFKTFKNAGIRVELDDSGETLGKRVRGAEVAKIPYILVVGEKEKEAKTVSVRTYAKGQLGTMNVLELQKKITEEIAERSI